MSAHIFAPTPKRDQTLVSKATIRSLGRGKSAGSLRTVDHFLKENPQLKKIFNRHEERRTLAKELYERGGGKSASSASNRFGYTESDLVDTLKTMRKRGLISRQEMIRAARTSFKSSGAYKRKNLQELYTFNPSRAEGESSSPASERKTNSKNSEKTRSSNPLLQESPSIAKTHTEKTNREGSSMHSSRPSRNDRNHFFADRFLERSKTRQQLALDILKRRREERGASDASGVRSFVGSKTDEQREMKEQEEQEAVLKRAEGVVDANQSKQSKQSNSREKAESRHRRSIYTDIFSHRNQNIRDYGRYTKPSSSASTERQEGGVARSNTKVRTSGYTDVKRFLPATPKRNLSTGLIPPRISSEKRSLPVKASYSGIPSVDVHRKVK